jgi:hypothetical protein
LEIVAGNLTAYCGLDCSQCFGYGRTVSEAAKNLRRTMRAEKMKQAWPLLPFLGDCEPFKKTLGGLASLGCSGCREGGGPPWCKIRKCAQRRDYDTCAQCDDLESCDRLVSLEPGHKSEHLEDLRKLKKVMA